METTFSKDRITGLKYIAFFDLDSTLTDVISGKALAACAYRKGLMKSSDLVTAIYLLLLYRLNLRDPLKIIDDMVSRVKGIPEQAMNDLCSEVFLKVLLPSVFREAKTEIKQHKENGAKVVILSSGLEQICREMAKSIEMDDIICSVLEVRDGYFTGRPLGRLCFGKEKVIRLIEYCKHNNVNPRYSWYYGDSFSDLPVLDYVGNPVCVNPDKKLKKAAHNRGWKVLYWH